MGKNSKPQYQTIPCNEETEELQHIIDEVPNDATNKLTEVRVFVPGYKQWRGKNIILCKGRVICSSFHWKFVLLIAFILIPSIIHLSTTARILLVLSKPAALIGSTILLFLCILFVLLAHSTDPGIIPRPQESEVPTNAYSATIAHDNSKNITSFPWDEMRNIDGTVPHWSFPFRQTINIGGKIVTHKYCITCNINRPPHSFHCNVCNNCVEGFQFHDDMMGCIGRRNYKYFLLFLITLNIYMIYVAYYSFILFKYGWLLCNDCSSLESFKAMCKLYPFTVSIVILETLTYWFVFLLTALHLYNTIRGRTLHEAHTIHDMELSDDDCYMPEMRLLQHLLPYSNGISRTLWNIIKLCPMPSNIHIHHIPPNIENDNEAIINKKIIHYLNPDIVKHKLDYMSALVICGYIRNVQQTFDRDSFHIIPEEIVFICFAYMDLQRYFHQCGYT